VVKAQTTQLRLWFKFTISFSYQKKLFHLCR